MTQNRWKNRVYSTYASTHALGASQYSVQETLRLRKPDIQLLIQRFFPENRDARILDLGCGYGALLYFLKQAGYTQLKGVDISPEQVALAHELGLSQVQALDVMDFLTAESSESNDIVALLDIIEHFEMQQLFDILDEVYRILVPGGKCIIHVPNAEGLFGLRIRYGDLTHELAYTPQSLHQLIRTIGFQSVQVYEDKPVVHSVTSLIRRVIWEVASWPLRLLLAAEIGSIRGLILTQNMFAVVRKET